MAPRYKDENRKQKMGETRERLLNAAVEEFAREGFVSANVSRITRAAGVATGTIYNYFPSKRDLMFAILNETGTAHCAFIADHILQEDDIIVRMERFFEVGFAFVMERPLHGQVLFATLQGADIKFKEHLSQLYLPLFQLLSEEILIPGMAQGVFHPLDPVSTSVMIMTFYLGVGSTVDESGKIPLDLKDVAAFVLRALGVKFEIGNE